jgi:hypothetical protein
VTLAKAVYGQNNRGTISSLQRAGRVMERKYKAAELSRNSDILDDLVEDEIWVAGANEEEQKVRKSTRVTRKMRKLL